MTFIVVVKSYMEVSNETSDIFTGDIIVADRGFTCNDYAGMAMAEVKIPPFTRGKKQLEKKS